MAAELLVAIIDQVQIFDEQVMPQRTGTDQRLHFGQRRLVHNPAAGSLALALLAYFPLARAG